MGQCFLTAGEGGQYVTYPSEGGHAEWAPKTNLEIHLLEFLKKKFEAKHRVSVERIVSGTGLANVYEFMSQEFKDEIDIDRHEKIMAAGDNQGREIAIGAQVKGSLCDKTLKTFIAAYGSEAGVACLKWMPFNGLYLTGGITPKNIDRISEPDGDFMHAFYDKGRVSPFLKRIPVYAVLVEDVGERGAHLVAVKKYLSMKNDSVTTASKLQRTVWQLSLVTMVTLIAIGGLSIAKKK